MKFLVGGFDRTLSLYNTAILFVNGSVAKNILVASQFSIEWKKVAFLSIPGVEPMPVGLTHELELVEKRTFLQEKENKFRLDLIGPQDNIRSIALYGRNYDLDV